MLASTLKNALAYYNSGGGLTPVSNPTIASYNASAVKIYNATSSLERFENKTNFLYYDKRPTLLERWHCSCKF
jgi:hypothetical protein